MAVYFEARSEPVAGQIAVAEVIENRVQSARFPDDHCSVVQQGRHWLKHPLKHQCHFTFWCDGKPETVLDLSAWTKALDVAARSVNGELVEITGKATHYHTKAVNPYWSYHGEITQAIGEHIFYKL